MKLKEIVQRLDDFAPPELAYFEKQNGLLSGSLDIDAKKIGITLDFTNNTLSKAIENKYDLLIIHNSGNYDSAASGLFKKNLEKARNNKIAVFQMHLNLDFCRNGIIDNLCKIMGFEGTPARLSYNGSTITGGVYVSKTALSFNELIDRINRINPKTIIICGRKKDAYNSIAITSGSGCKSEFLEQLKIDAFICGQIGHEAMRASEELGITLISATNYSTENEPLKIVAKKIQEIIPETNIEFIEEQDSIEVVK
jgi:dinuclear metal center YbgI/SA1388 family protein